MKISKIILIVITAFFLVNLLLISKKPKIYLAGDSTMAEKLEEKRPETGWGEKIGLFFNDDIAIENHAKNGRSTKTFIKEGRWQKIIDSVSAGDFIIIQFGHNDQSESKIDRYTPPEDFKKNLAKFVNESRNKNAVPILLTPVMRRRFDEKGKFYDVHGEYPELVREVAKKLKVYLIDLHNSSEKLFIELGEEETKKLFLILQQGESSNYPEGKEDNTHFSDFGAEMIAKLVAEEIKNSEIGLKDYLLK